MTKRDEIEMFEKFYESCPKDSYLRSILEGTPALVANMILDDFGFSITKELRELRTEKAVQAEEIKDGEMRVAELKANVRKLEQDRAKIEVAISDMKATARTIFNAK